MATRFPYGAEQRLPEGEHQGPFFSHFWELVVGTKRIDLEAHGWPQCPRELVLV